MTQLLCARCCAFKVQEGNKSRSPGFHWCWYMQLPVLMDKDSAGYRGWDPWVHTCPGVGTTGIAPKDLWWWWPARHMQQSGRKGFTLHLERFLNPELSWKTQCCWTQLLNAFLGQICSGISCPGTQQGELSFGLTHWKPLLVLSLVTWERNQRPPGCSLLPGNFREH